MSYKIFLPFACCVIGHFFAQTQEAYLQNLLGVDLTTSIYNAQGIQEDFAYRLLGVSTENMGVLYVMDRNLGAKEPAKDASDLREVVKGYSYPFTQIKAKNVCPEGFHLPNVEEWQAINADKKGAWETQTAHMYDRLKLVRSNTYENQTEGFVPSENKYYPLTFYWSSSYIVTGGAYYPFMIYMDLFFITEPKSGMTKRQDSLFTGINFTASVRCIKNKTTEFPTVIKNQKGQNVLFHFNILSNGWLDRNLGATEVPSDYRTDITPAMSGWYYRHNEKTPVAINGTGVLAVGGVSGSPCPFGTRLPLASDFNALHATLLGSYAFWGAGLNSLHNYYKLTTFGAYNEQNQFNAQTLALWSADLQSNGYATAFNITRPGTENWIYSQINFANLATIKPYNIKSAYTIRCMVQRNILSKDKLTIKGDFIAFTNNTYYLDPTKNKLNIEIDPLLPIGQYSHEVYKIVYTALDIFEEPSHDLEGVQNWKNFTTNNITIWDNTRTSANVYLNKHYRVQIYVGMELYKDFYVKYSYVYESKLPLIYFNTAGKKGTCNDKIYQNGNFKIIVPVNNTLARVSSDYNEVIKMKLRGSTSCSFPQQPYTFKFLTEDLQKKNVALLGMPAHDTWVIVSNGIDHSLVRNRFANDLGRKIDRYAPRMQSAEVFLDGEYKGIYSIGEKVERDRNRVNIQKAGENGHDGGYIIKYDKWDNTAVQWSYKDPEHGNTIPFEYDTPSEPTLVQRKHMEEYVDNFAKALHSENFLDSLTGWRKYADESSFIDFLLLKEIYRDVDGLYRSTFLHKDANGKLMAGPLWDHDRSLGGGNEDNICNIHNTDKWGYQMMDICSYRVQPFWWRKLMEEDVVFKSNFMKRYTALRKNVLSDAEVIKMLATYEQELKNDAVKHYTRWGVGNKDITSHINVVKNFVIKRMAWLDKQLSENYAVIQSPFGTHDLYFSYGIIQKGQITQNGKTHTLEWMDRNLGALRPPKAINDEKVGARGFLYHWQSKVPHGTMQVLFKDYKTHNANLAKPETGEPCPDGFHTATDVEYQLVIQQNNIATSCAACGSDPFANYQNPERRQGLFTHLKMNGLGYRFNVLDNQNAIQSSLVEKNKGAFWWCLDRVDPFDLGKAQGVDSWSNFSKKHGLHVRCVKDYNLGAKPEKLIAYALPNPFGSNDVQIKFTYEPVNASYKLFDASQNLIKSGFIQQDYPEFIIDMRTLNLPEGTYHLVVEEDGVVEKIILQK
jgi:uncharacterized protein (TIGR02145 family)